MEGEDYTIIRHRDSNDYAVREMRYAWEDVEWFGRVIVACVSQGVVREASYYDCEM